jgi:hypothetical protein
VFGTQNFNAASIARFVIGPSLIALGVSIGSGEWLLGPLSVATYGFTGIGWIILVSAVLQTFYNVELARFTIATGETPVIGFGRAPGGVLWVFFAVFCLYLAFITGGWISGAGQALFALIFGRAADTSAGHADVTTFRLMGIGLLFLVFVIVLFGKKISRTLEIANWIMVVGMLAALLVLIVAIVPPANWADGFVSLVTPAAPPKGSDAMLLGALAGFTATASGLNYFLISYYRDKGYGMGHRVGFIAALVGGKQEKIEEVGKMFPESEANTRQWKRWFRFLLLEQWGIFFCGALLGMVLPATLVGYLATVPGAAKATAANMPVYAAFEIHRLGGVVLFYLALAVGFLILFSTQMVVFETLVRNMTDAMYATSERFRKLISDNPQRFYYPFMLALLVVMGVIIFQALPTELIAWAANMANFAALFFPLVLIYVNARLPRPAKPPWWTTVVLILNALFFGFFFLNFASSFFFKAPLVSF